MVLAVLKDGSFGESITEIKPLRQSQEVFSNSDWTIKRQDVEFGDAIGRGEFAGESDAYLYSRIFMKTI